MRLSLSSILLVLLTSQLSAEVRVILGNGDSLRGSVVKVADGVIHFDSEALGLLTLPASGVVIEEVNAGDTSPILLLTNDSEPEEKLQIIEEGPPEEAPKEEIPAVVVPPKWTKNIEFGVTMQSGRKDQLDASARFAANRKVQQDQYRIKARYLYGESNNTRSNNLFESSFRWRRDFSPRLFSQALTYYGNNENKHIKHDFSQSAGLGRKIYNLDTFSLSMGGGATARYRDENGDPPGWNYMVDAFQDLEYAINSIFQVSQDASILIEPADPDNYTLVLNAALVGKISETVSMSMRYEYEYDNSLTSDNRLSQRIITSLGYFF